MSEQRWVIAKLSVFFVIAFIYQQITGFEPAFEAGASPWWKYLTSVIGHSSWEHLMNNLFFIGVFGTVLELETSGTKAFNIFVLSALFANISAFIFYPQTGIIGASAGGTGLLAALAVLRPRNIGLALGVPLPMWAVLPIYIVTNLIGIPAQTGIAYEAHLMGMAAGAIAGYYLKDDEEHGKEQNKQENEEKEELEKEEWREKIRSWEEEYMMD